MQPFEPLPVRNPFSGAPVYYIEETDSTMEDAVVLAGAGAVHGTVVRAGFQRKGRGRVPGRVWEAGAGDNLLCTIILSSSSIGVPPFRLPLLAGLAVARYLESRHGLTPVIKWPNDVLADGKKICGILCEARGDTLLAGIGLNCNQTIFSPGLPSTSVALLTGTVVNIDRELPELLSVLEAALAESARAGDGWRTDIERRLYGKGAPVTFLAGLPGRQERVEGVVLGIGPDGELLMRREETGEITSWFSGEITFHRTLP